VVLFWWIGGVSWSKVHHVFAMFVGCLKRRKVVAVVIVAVLLYCSVWQQLALNIALP
jgi:hypothetical protein